jgi:ATP/ADP translocase
MGKFWDYSASHGPEENRANRIRRLKMFPTAYLTPVVSLIAGILILMIPRLLNYIVAIYLIVIGILGLVHH